MTATAVVLLPLAAAGWLLVAPRDLAGVRWGGVSLGWWASVLACGLSLLALALASRPLPSGGRDRSP